MSFRGRLVVGHVVLVAIVLLIGTVTAIAQQVTSDRLESLARDLAADLVEIQQLRYEAEQVVSTGRGYLLSADPQTLVRFDDAVLKVNGSLDRLARREDLAEEVARVRDAAGAYIANAQSAARRRAESGDPRVVLPFFEQTLAPARDRFEAALDALVTGEQRTFDERVALSRRLADGEEAIVTLATTVAVMLAGGLAWLSIRGLSSQYAREREATEEARRATAAREEILAVVSHDLRTR